MPLILCKKFKAVLSVVSKDWALPETNAATSPYFTFDVPGAKFAPAYKRGGWNGQICLLSKTSGEIYAGLLDKVIAKIKNHGYSYEFKK